MLRPCILVSLTHGGTFSSSEKSLSSNLPLNRNVLSESNSSQVQLMSISLPKSMPICSSFHFKAITFFWKFSSTDTAQLHHSCTWLQSRLLNLWEEGTRNPGKEEEYKFAVTLILFGGVNANFTT